MKKERILAQRASCVARRAAINLGGLHRKHEGAIGALVPVKRSLPVTVSGRAGDSFCVCVLVLRLHSLRLPRFGIAIYPISDGKLMSRGLT
jgi:hypothetical protein